MIKLRRHKRVGTWEIAKALISRSITKITIILISRANRIVLSLRATVRGVDCSSEIRYI